MNATIKNRPAFWVLEYLGRAFGALVLLAVASFCVFGFYESFEPGNGLAWQLGYAAAGSAFLVGALGLLLRPKTARIMGGLALLAAATFCVLGFMASYLTRGWPWPLVYGVSGCVCLIGAAAMLRAKEKGSGNAVRFLYYAIGFVLFGIFSCKFAVHCLIPWLSWWVWNRH